MDFVVKECIFLAFFCLSSGAFGADIEPFIKNTVVLAGSTAQLACASSRSPVNVTWSMWPVGGQQIIAIASGDLVVDPETFETVVETESYLFVKKAYTSTAGVYTCDEGRKQSAQLIVVIEEPACNFNPKPNEKRSSDEISQLSCTMRYVANDSYVVANVIWSSYGSSESLKSHVEKSTSANITKATSTLNIIRSENLTCASIYICTPTFSLKDNLPSGFATKEPYYAKVCSPNADACETYQPVCNFDPEPNEALPRNEISHLSCTVKYVANSFYVFSDIDWSVDGSMVLPSSKETSSSANITTTTSTLNITENSRCASVYRCDATFRVTDKFPSWDRQEYNGVCSISVPNAAACDTYQPACNFAREPNEISKLSCTLKYAASESYVVADMKWSIDGSSESLKSSMETSTSANITTATSTLNIARCASKYRCTTTFSLREELPIVFAWNKPSFARDCLLSVPNPVECKYEKSTNKPHEKPRNRWTTMPRENSVEKSGGNSDEESGGNSVEKSGVTPGKNAGGLSFGLSKRNIVINCVVGIAGLLLIGTGTGV